ncbi:hypothetical protein W97_05828 [Coniosporium apollinis CBS 100218]|uniref:Uncharacterized protein n=1 Tax=Coniosporium apollinis (strain CBS 100218) TaxID=1168221 RepID=R7YXH2_CONA1|nr:uncharacterized protein W97_05828 [Coniosporium apollinis CBS 100218]EON66582.1 hypothetical protein W97_05828 [Coniosporium apollinis CBS 100218]
MLSRTLGRVSRPTNAYVCLSCRVHQYNQTRSIRNKKPAPKATPKAPAPKGNERKSVSDGTKPSPPPAKPKESKTKGQNTSSHGTQSGQPSTTAAGGGSEKPGSGSKEVTKKKKKKPGAPKKTAKKGVRRVVKGPIVRKVEATKTVEVAPVDDPVLKAMEGYLSAKADLSEWEKERLETIRELLKSPPKASESNNAASKSHEEDASKRRAGVAKRSCDVGQEFSAMDGHRTLKDALKGSAKKKTSRKRSDEDVERISVADLEITALDIEQPPVPGLAHDLSRVLFNPGVYHLQDSRSRVYNFDPYLEKIMPVAEFDFNALKEYITSSQDEVLSQIAKEQGKKYVGSTSSMTGVLTRFHYLLSHWREININMLSKRFPEQSRQYTLLNRSPTAIFLRWKNGTYAIDADKEFDTANVLSMLGKSMEKLLTLPTAEFERYRRTNSYQISEQEREQPEAFHYSTLGDFLMRSQLDAHDPRLPGTGMFDLKTRAVVSIRMDASEYQQYTGYQIKHSQGKWESYEREYYDMIRSTMLKYSLQARMGRMDGIFVAYHNVERIFGFQYISLAEMDDALHGQRDTALGDQEFMLSIDLLNKVLNRATEKFPETSIRLHFETRDAVVPFMYIFAEPVTEAEAQRIQNTNKAESEAYERAMLGLDRGTKATADQKSKKDWQDIKAQVESEMDADGAAASVDPKTTAADADDDEADAEDRDGKDDDDEDEENDEDEEDEENEEDEEDEEGEEEDDDDHEEEESDEEAEDSNLLDDETTEPQEDESATSASNPAEAEPNKPADSSDSSPNPSPDPDTTGFTPWPPYIPTPGEDLNPHLMPLLAMSLTVRNKVNNEYVKRPSDLTASDEWDIEYSLSEIEDASRAWTVYEACKQRRAKQFIREEAEGKPSMDFYRDQLRELSRRGRRWRSEQDALDDERGLVVYRPEVGVAEKYKGAAGGNGKDMLSAGEKVDGVEDYLGWLFSRRKSDR